MPDCNYTENTLSISGAAVFQTQRICQQALCLLLGFLLVAPVYAEKIRLQLKWFHQFQFSGYYVAKQLGYYEEEGLDVEILEFSRAYSSIDSLLYGRVDYAVSDSTTLLYRANGVPVVALASIFQHSPAVLISNLHDSETLADLKGRRMVLSGVARASELSAMLAMRGLQLDDMTQLKASEPIEAFISGDTDSFNGYGSNELYILEKRQVPYRVFRPRDFGIDFYEDVLITLESTVRDNPQQVERFLRASLRGWQYAVDNPEAAIAIILEHFNSQQKSREHLQFEAQRSIALIDTGGGAVGAMSRDRWQAIGEVFRKHGFLNKNVELESFLFTPSQQRPMESDSIFPWRWLLGGAITVVLVAGALTILRLRKKKHVYDAGQAVALANSEGDGVHDPVTGLLLEATLPELAAPLLAIAEAEQRELSLLVIDVDLFKVVNDKYGREAGDCALNYIAHFFEFHLQAADICVRLEGDQFIVISLDTNIVAATELAEALRKSVAAGSVDGPERYFGITVSIGIASRRDDGDSLDAMIERADRALDTAKRDGRNRVSSQFVESSYPERGVKSPGNWL